MWSVEKIISKYTKIENQLTQQRVNFLNIMRILILLLGIIGLCCNAAAEEFLVRLKTPKTLAKLMESKIGNGQLKSILEGKVLRSFSFGKFEAIAIDFPAEWASRLRKNPLVADIVPNIKFNIFDENNIFTIEAANQTRCSKGKAKHIEYDGKDKTKKQHDEEDDDDDEDDEDHYEDDEEDEEEEEDDIDDSDDPVNDIAVQTDAPRHLARISRRGPLPYSELDEDPEKFDYYYDEDYLGYSVNAYIIDTGIFKDHHQFQGRAHFGADLVGEGPGDFNGHGTHVAGIVGSEEFGVAKEVRLIEVKALNKVGQGNLTTVLSAIEFSVKHCRRSRRGCVANLSLGSFRNTVLNQAVEAAMESGLVVVAAAGNSNANACWSSPASSPAAITVGAFDDRTDTIARFSNWGSCVDIFAPGVTVESLSNVPPFEPVTYSGTSMASPIVAGLAALLLDSGVEPRDIKTAIIGLATDGVFLKRTLIFKPGTPNRIVFSGVDKEDDFFEDSKYPLVNVEELVKDLEEYNRDLRVSKDDAILPVRKRAAVTLAPWA